MSVAYLLDTSIVSLPISKTPHPEVLKRLERRQRECAIAAPVRHELIYGVRRLPRGKRRSALDAYIREVVHASFPILPYDEAAAAWHAQQRARLEARGRPAPYVDGQIAAIANVNGLVLVTTNVREFAGFDGLRVEDWSRSTPAPRPGRH